MSQKSGLCRKDIDATESSMLKYYCIRVPYDYMRLVVNVQEKESGFRLRCVKINSS